MLRHECARVARSFQGGTSISMPCFGMLDLRDVELRAALAVGYPTQRTFDVIF